MTQAGPTGQDPAPPSDSGSWGEGGGGSSSGFQVKTVVTEKGPAPGIVYAELPMRIVAYIIDAVILGIGLSIVTSILFGILAFTGLWLIAWVVSAVAVVAASGAYFVWSWTNLQASPGQKLLNLQTLDARTGKVISRDQAIKRYIYLYWPLVLAQVFVAGFVLVLLIPIVWLISIGYSLWLLYTVTQNPKRQGYHDVQAGTVVIQRVAAA
jgi:uncharacterized RDD family membrane protein YckC